MYVGMLFKFKTENSEILCLITEICESDYEIKVKMFDDNNKEGNGGFDIEFFKSCLNDGTITHCIKEERKFKLDKLNEKDVRKIKNIK